MGKGKDIVITVYGHKDVIDNFAVSLFDKPDSENSGYNKESNADMYCNALNKLRLEGESWVLARIVPENTPLSMDFFYPVKFETILELDDRTIQRVIREVDSQDLAKALKNEHEEVQGKIFRNMSLRASAMLREDMEFMGPIRTIDIKKSQERIVQVIHHLEETGEIIKPLSKGDTAE